MPQVNCKSVAITCTQPRCDEIVTDLISCGLHAYASPILSIHPIDTPMPIRNYDAVLITSIHAVTNTLPQNLPYIAVGEHTAQQLEKNGFTVVDKGHGGVRNVNLSSYKTILYPCAKNPTYIPSTAVPWVTYESRIITDFKWTLETNIITVFSISAARAVRPYVQPHVQIACLSQIIADVFVEHPVENLAVCTNPHYDDMKYLVQSLARTDNKKDF